MKFKAKQTLFFILEIAQIVAIALVIVVPIRYFVFQPFIVRGASMEPNFHNGDYLIVDELTYRFRSPARGEVIVFDYPQDPSQRFIKRIIGLPQETIALEGNQIVVTDKQGNQLILDENTYLTDSLWLGKKTVTLAKEEYFVMGDNRSHSFDSRRWGPVKEREIIGRAVLRAWPLDGLAALGAPSY